MKYLKLILLLLSLFVLNSCMAGSLITAPLKVAGVAGDVASGAYSVGKGVAGAALSSQ